MRRAARTFCILTACVFMSASFAWGGYKMQVDSDTKAEIGFWTQAWYQFVEDGASDGGTTEERNDFMIRRAYLNIKGQVTPQLSFFTHLASDRVGQEGLDSAGVGLGSGVAWRDLWITWTVNESFKIQAGRMYVPLTRNYGTTSTKSLLTTELTFLQGGIRGGIFYASKVGRDDGVTIWGNPFGGMLQYRFMVSEGVENSSNPEDHLRCVGRVALNLMDPETGWFNSGTYLGKKQVLSFGAGYDFQDALTLGGVAGQENRVWTVDAFLDQPMGTAALTLETAFIHINNSTQSHNFSDLSAGDDARTWYVQTGVLLPGRIGQGRLQPYLRYETIGVDGRGKYDTTFYTGGIHYYIKGHDGKVSLDYTRVDHDVKSSNPLSDETGIVTLQLAIGF